MLSLNVVMTLISSSQPSWYCEETSVKEFANIRQNGLKALNLKDEDELINVLLTEEDTDIIIGTKFGYAVRFNQSAVRGMSRIATGVKGVNLREETQ